MASDRSVERGLREKLAWRLASLGDNSPWVVREVGEHSKEQCMGAGDRSTMGLCLKL